LTENFRADTDKLKEEDTIKENSGWVKLWGMWLLEVRVSINHPVPRSKQSTSPYNNEPAIAV
jgi:hypothetical protein